MFGYEEEKIILCINCDAEYTVARMDDDESGDEPEFCPFCGFQHNVEDDDEDEDFDEDLDS